MRSVIFGFAMIVLFAGTSFAQENQEPAAWLAARQCKITPTEGPQLRAALQEFVDHARANPPSVELPGTVYGNFRQRVWGDANWTTVYEVASIAAYDQFVRARGEWFRQDEKAGELYRAIFSHTVSQSCQTAFHQRWP